MGHKLQKSRFKVRLSKLVIAFDSAILKGNIAFLFAVCVLRIVGNGLWNAIYVLQALAMSGMRYCM